MRVSHIKKTNVCQFLQCLSSLNDIAVYISGFRPLWVWGLLLNLKQFQRSLYANSCTSGFHYLTEYRMKTTHHISEPLYPHFIHPSNSNSNRGEDKCWLEQQDLLHVIWLLRVLGITSSSPSPTRSVVHKLGTTGISRVLSGNRVLLRRALN